MKKIRALEAENFNICEQMNETNENLKYIDNLRKLQLKERNLLLRELSIQLLLLRENSTRKRYDYVDDNECSIYYKSEDRLQRQYENHDNDKNQNTTKKV